ncbi:MAG: 5-formyltetrahydrofolate cyclo-ligase [Actinobacteria bacterium]|nr:MAG: 5-formyltetrahydrofolate cyclo-ligase [Actinomycetota bacterium]
MDKSVLRERILQYRKSLGLSQRQKKSFLVKHKLFNSKEYKQAKNLLFYCSYGSEVITYLMIEETLAFGKKVFLPLCTQNNLQVREIKSLSDLNPGYGGILEPTENTREVKPQEIDLVIVPGVCFDKTGYRLGYGKGFYDRFLKDVPQVKKIGLCYCMQLVEKLDCEAHDIPVDMIISEEGITDCHRLA